MFTRALTLFEVALAVHGPRFHPERSRRVTRVHQADGGRAFPRSLRAEADVVGGDGRRLTDGKTQLAVGDERPSRGLHLKQTDSKSTPLIASSRWHPGHKGAPHRAEESWILGHQVANAKREREHSPAHRAIGQDSVDEMRGTIEHVPVFHDGQKPRPLHGNAARSSRPQLAQGTRAKPKAKTPHSK